MTPSIVRLYPGTWVGVRIPYVQGVSQLWNEWAKSAVPLRTLDVSTKTWWMPVGSATLAVNEAANLGLVALDAVEPSMRFIDRVVNSRGWGVNYPANAATDAYAILGLAPDAPPLLIDLAYRFWKNQFASSNDIEQEMALDAAFTTLGGRPFQR